MRPCLIPSVLLCAACATPPPASCPASLMTVEPEPAAPDPDDPDTTAKTFATYTVDVVGWGRRGWERVDACAILQAGGFPTSD